MAAIFTKLKDLKFFPLGVGAIVGMSKGKFQCFSSFSHEAFTITVLFFSGTEKNFNVRVFLSSKHVCFCPTTIGTATYSTLVVNLLARELGRLGEGHSR